jgi:DNA-binding MarR family transcriptional regulator
MNQIDPIHVSASFLEELHRIDEKIGMSAAYTFALVAVSPGIRCPDPVRRLRVDRSTIHRVKDRLQDEYRLIRAVQEDFGRREFRLYLSPIGAELCERVRSYWARPINPDGEA